MVEGFISNVTDKIMPQIEEWLEPLYNVMKDQLLAEPVIHADETVIQVLKEPGKNCGFIHQEEVQHLQYYKNTNRHDPASTPEGF